MIKNVLCQASTFTLGCYYRSGGTGFMSMYGSVTDAQVFSRELTDQEMVDMTTCKAFLKGDMIQWETESWDLKSPLQSSEEEMLDLERDICDAPERGLFMVPHKLTLAESQHTCKKLSGFLVSYTSSQEFDYLLYFLSLSINMKSGGCVEKLEDGNNIEVWAGGSDQDKEGEWVTWNTKETIQV